jgi:hypothetical protein
MKEELAGRSLDFDIAIKPYWTHTHTTNVIPMAQNTVRGRAGVQKMQL